MIEEAAGCLRALIRGTVYVLSIVFGAFTLFVLVILVLGGIYWYLNFLLQFNALGVLIGLLAPFVLLISGVYFLAELAKIRERKQGTDE